MNRQFKALTLAVVGLGLGAFACGSFAQQEPGPAERAGEQLDRILGDVREGFKDLSSEVQSRFARVRQEVDDMGVEARVYGRLHWDVALEDAELAVEVVEGRQVVLHGSVPDAAAKARALDLAGTTQGVEEVVDHLIIRPVLDEQGPGPEGP